MVRCVCVCVCVGTAAFLSLEVLPWKGKVSCRAVQGGCDIHGVFDLHLQTVFFKGSRDLSFAALKWKDLESQEAVTLKLLVPALQYVQHVNRIHSSQHMVGLSGPIMKASRKGISQVLLFTGAQASNVHDRGQFVGATFF